MSLTQDQKDRMVKALSKGRRFRDTDGVVQFLLDLIADSPSPGQIVEIRKGLLSEKAEEQSRIDNAERDKLAVVAKATATIAEIDDVLSQPELGNGA